jgi:hypothetical protein
MFHARIENKEASMTSLRTILTVSPAQTLKKMCSATDADLPKETNGLSEEELRRLAWHAEGVRHFQSNNVAIIVFYMMLLLLFAGMTTRLAPQKEYGFLIGVAGILVLLGAVALMLAVEVIGPATVRCEHYMRELEKISKLS